MRAAVPLGAGAGAVATPGLAGLAISPSADRARRIIASNRLRVRQTLGSAATMSRGCPAGGTVAFPGSCGSPTSTASSIGCSSNITPRSSPAAFFGHPQHVRVAFGMGAEELAAASTPLPPPRRRDPPRNRPR
jgi:hypothetical protein